jgi:DNA-binding transcriptional LysR family regulator
LTSPSCFVNNGPMRDLNDLYFFVQVVDHGGFAPAARALGLPKSRLSRRILMLEQRLGVRLIQRSTRNFTVTAIGQEYYRHCVAMLVEAEAAQDTIDRSRAEPQGMVRLSCPPGLVCFKVGDILARFMARHPQVRVHLESTSRRVDVIAEGFDIAVRVRFPPLEESDLVMRVLAGSPQHLVASPALFDGNPTPQTPADLADIPSIDFGPPQRPHQWRLEGPDGDSALVTQRPRLITDDFVQMRLAVLRGIGIAQLPDFVVDDDLAAGTLVEVLPQWRPRAGIIHAVFPSRRGLLPAVRGLLDFFAQEFAGPTKAPAQGGATGQKERPERTGIHNQRANL